MRKVGEIDLVSGMPPCPTEDGEVGDRQFIREELVRGQPAVHHVVQAPGFLRIARQSVATVVFIRDRREVMDLSRYRSEISHLEHEPFENRDARLQIALVVTVR